MKKELTEMVLSVVILTGVPAVATVTISVIGFNYLPRKHGVASGQVYGVSLSKSRVYGRKLKRCFKYGRTRSRFCQRRHSIAPDLPDSPRLG